MLDGKFLLTVAGWVVKPFSDSLYQRVRDRFVIDLDPDRSRAEAARGAQKLDLAWRRKVGGEVPALLDWRANLVGELIGRSTELAELDRWVEEGEPVRARLVVGEGGTGKTRLAAELAQRYRDSGWKAGFADLSGTEPLLFPVPVAGGRGTLILLDYPEERREVVQGLLRRAGRLSGQHVRLLLLTRREAAFWEQELREDSTASLFDSRPLYLQPPDEAALVRLFHAAVRELPERLQPPRPPVPAEGVFERWMVKDAVHRRPLFVLAAALSHVLEPETGLENLSAAEVLHALVLRERRQLRRQSEQAGLSPEALPRLVALAAIAGGLDSGLLRSLAQREEVLEIGCPPPGELVQRLRRGGHLASGASRLPALRPDLFAAAFLHDTLRKEEQAPEWIWAVLEPGLPASVDAFGRLCHDAEHVLGLRDPRLATWLAQAVTDAPERAWALGPPLGRPHLSLALQEVGVTVDRWLLADASNEAERARRLNNLGARLYFMGRGKEALAASEEAASLYRQLAANRPEVFLPDLARSVSNLGSFYFSLGHREQALAASEEAVRIRRQLAADRREAFLPDLAMCFSNLGRDLSFLGRREEALAAGQESVSLYRQLTTARREAFLPDLARSLTNLGNRFASLGRREEAFAASEEAVRIRRQLAAARPEAFLPNLATSVSVLSDCQEALGRATEALEATVEAARLLLPFYRSQPAAFRGLMTIIAGQYVRRADVAGSDPDPQLGRELREIATEGGSPSSPAVPRSNAGASVAELR